MQLSRGKWEKQLSKVLWTWQLKKKKKKKKKERKENITKQTLTNNKKLVVSMNTTSKWFKAFRYQTHMHTHKKLLLMHKHFKNSEWSLVWMQGQKCQALN